MGKLIFGMNQSLDGFVDHDLFDPDPVLFAYFIELTRNSAGAIYGRRLYEIMSYWDGDDWDRDDVPGIAALRDFAAAWRAQPKWVVSSSLDSVGPNAAVLQGDLEAEVRKLKQQTSGYLEVGGPTLAQHLGALGLIDEYHIYVHPVVAGTGRRFFTGPTPPLRLMDDKRIGDEAIRLTYVPAP